MNDYSNCFYCGRIAASCPLRNEDIPFDGTMCPYGYGKERLEKWQKSEENKAKWSAEKKAEMAAKKRAQYAALSDDEKQARREKIRAGRLKKKNPVDQTE